MQAFPITLELNNIEELLVVHQDNPFQPNFRLMSGIQEIVEILSERGIPIARRTVAKYRSELNILPSNLRKMY